MNERALIIGLVGVLTAGLVAMFFLLYEKETYEHFVQPTGEAARNPLLAAQRFLDASGFETATQSKFTPSLTPLGVNDTAIATFNYHYLPEAELDLLLDWVAQGGHLIVQIQPEYGNVFDPVFTAIGVATVLRARTEPDDDAPPAAEVPLDGAARDDREAWGDQQYDNGVSNDPGTTQPLWAVHDQHGVFAAEFRYARGRLTAVADLGVIANASIGKLDHAFLLTRFVGPPEDADQVWLLHTSEVPSLWSILMDRAGYLFFAGVALLALLLWWASQRFGPSIAPPLDERKAFVEHIEASGRFLWRHQQRAKLLESTQHAFLRAATRRHPQLRRLDSTQRDAYLARVCGVTEQSAADALLQTGLIVTRIKIQNRIIL